MAETIANVGAYNARHSIASMLEPVHVPEAERAAVLESQLDSIDKLSTVLVLMNLLNSALVLVMFSTEQTHGWLGLWGSWLSIICTLMFFRSISMPSGPARGRRHSDDALQYILTALLFGMSWASLAAIIMPVTDPYGQMALAVVLAGMVFGATLTLSRLPMAAFAFSLPVICSLCLEFFLHSDVRGTSLALMTVGYMIVISICVRWNYNQFVVQHLNKAAVAQQNGVIGLLLRDFEESTSDWLWQTDPQGILLEIPTSLKGDKTGYDMMRKGQVITDLFRPSEARNVLQQCLVRQSGFRDLVLEVDDADASSKRWWSLTGKPMLDGDQLVGFRGVASDVTASKEIEDRIAHLAHFDGLTGLPNRASFQEHLERTCGRPAGGDMIHATILLDLDNFKWVNDTLGHAAGDEVLRQMAGRLAQHVRPKDVAARLGGDEFAMVLKRESKAHLRATLDELVAVLNRPYDLWGSTANCGASIGVRLFKPGNCDPQQLLTHADLALYQAKQGGKGAWCLFTPELDEKAQARRIIERDLHDALSRDELYLEFQPIVSAQTGEVVACETLVRWHHPVRGVIYPGAFIEHAEDCGLIVRLGDWVIRQALHEARRLPEHVRISVNISPLQLHSASLMTTIVQALARNSIAPARLDLEITESVLMADSEFVLNRLTQLRKLGLTLSLDDFGTGFSSLSYLRRFPFDKVKIDKSFVTDIETNDDSLAITSATVGLAKSLGLKCTAEGVETPAQRDVLRKLGCNELQGYLVSRPKRLDDLRHLFEVAGKSPQAAPVRPLAMAQPQAKGERLREQREPVVAAVAEPSGG